MTYEQMKKRARQLSPAELRRHASVSIKNRDHCRQCFCCACVDVLRENTSPYIAREQERLILENRWEQ
jgi:hypothetical protein